MIGSDLLGLAETIIESQTVTYYQYYSRIQNAVAQSITIYQNPVPMDGDLQPVPRRLYEQNGLDWSKNYVTFYTSNDVLSLDRNVNGDQFTFGNDLYQCQSNNDWFQRDGWKGVLAVRVGPLSNAPPMYYVSRDGSYYTDRNGTRYELRGPNA